MKFKNKKSVDLKLKKKHFRMHFSLEQKTSSVGF